MGTERIPLTEQEQLVAEMMASYVRERPAKVLDVTRELIALRGLLAACRVSRRSLPRSVRAALDRFAHYPASLRLRAAEADRQEDHP